MGRKRHTQEDDIVFSRISFGDFFLITSTVDR